MKQKAKFHYRSSWLESSVLCSIMYVLYNSDRLALPEWTIQAKLNRWRDLWMCNFHSFIRPNNLLKHFRKMQLYIIGPSSGRNRACGLIWFHCSALTNCMSYMYRLQLRCRAPTASSCTYTYRCCNLRCMHWFDPAAHSCPFWQLLLVKSTIV